MTVVSLRDVIKRTANGEKVVNGANLSVDDGEIVAVLGAADSGKGTLLSLIAGRQQASAGEIRIRGVVANKVPAGVHSRGEWLKIFDAGGCALVSAKVTSAGIRVAIVRGTGCRAFARGSRSLPARGTRAHN